MIREACEDDVPRLVDMGRRFIEESDYRFAIGVNEAALSRLMHKLIALDEGVVFVLTPAHTAIGMIGLHIFEHPLSDQSFAAELFWWVEPEHRGQGFGLLRQAENWAKERGAVKLQMIAPSDKVARYYQALGYSKLEEHYQKDL